MGDHPKLISIKEAAKRAGVSRRTIERWIAANKLEAIADDTDRRKRLVRLEALEHLLGRTPVASVERSRVQETPELDPHYQEIVDQTLQLVYSYYYRTIAHLAPAGIVRLTMVQLRSGPLGDKLRRLALIAQGAARESKIDLLTNIESVLQLLFWPADGYDYTVPRAFWDTELGRMLALAKFRAFAPGELITVANAAQELGVTRPVIYRWLDDRTLNYVRDEESGRTFVVRRDVDNLKNLAMELMNSAPTAHNPNGSEASPGEPATS